MNVQTGRLATIGDEERPGFDPPYDFPEYRSTALRAPKNPLLILPHTLSETTGPAFGEGTIGELDADLTKQHGGDPLGERIVVSGRVTDDRGHPVRNTLVEIWQANAAGRYAHQVDQHPSIQRKLRHRPLVHNLANTRIRRLQ